MATNVVFNGTTYQIPALNDENWGEVLSDFFIAIAGGALQKTGGTFTLTAEADFGATFGLKLSYLKSRATNPAAVGVIRLGNAEAISWRNFLNNNNLSLVVGADNILRFNGNAVLDTGGNDIIAETSFIIVNNQSAPADVTGLLFSHATVGKATIDYWIKRVTTSTGATERTEGGVLQATYDVGAGVWRLVSMPAGPDDSGVTFSITSGGQVQYVSDSITGTPSVSAMKFKATTMGV